MPDLALLLSGAALLAVGYLLGRARPIRAAQDWAWWATATGRTSALRVLVFYALHPRETWRAWRRRNTLRPPQRTPAPDLSPYWQDKLNNNGDDRD